MKLALLVTPPEAVGFGCTNVPIDISLAEQSPLSVMDALLESAETAPLEWLMDREFRGWLDIDVIKSPDVIIGTTDLLPHAEDSYKNIPIRIWDEPLSGRAAWASPEEITLRTLGDDRPFAVPEQYREAADELRTAGFWVGIFRGVADELYYGCRAPDDPDTVVDMQLLSMSATPVRIMMEELFAMEEARSVV